MIREDSRIDDSGLTQAKELVEVEKRIVKLQEQLKQALADRNRIALGMCAKFGPMPIQEAADKIKRFMAVTGKMVKERRKTLMRDYWNNLPAEEKQRRVAVMRAARKLKKGVGDEKQKV